MASRNTAKLICECVENEGVEVVFGIPGEENINLVKEFSVSSKLRFVLCRHEQAAAFMADIYGRLAGKAGVCTATLGPGAVNLMLGIVDAQMDSSPVVAITAQVGLNRIYKESHQIVDLEGIYKPVTKWANTLLTIPAVPETVRKAFDLAQSERPGAVYLAIPEDLEAADAPSNLKPLNARPEHRAAPDPDSIAAAVDLIKAAKKPVMMVGHGAARAGAENEVVALAESLGVPVATTFMGKGVIPDRHPQALGVIGFMRHDYENFAFDEADLIISVGFELQEFAPSRINPDGDKKIIHIHRFAEDEDACYPIAVSLEADIPATLTALNDAVRDAGLQPFPFNAAPIKELLEDELSKFANDTSFPVKPQRIVSDIRKVLDDTDVVLSDTGAIKMWMARLYQTQAPLTCIISNGLATMAWALPGALGAHFARPGQKILATMGDGGFMMNSQEIETAVRERIPLVVLVWVDNAYGLIKWKMDLEHGEHEEVDFGNPDFAKYAEAFGAQGHNIESADDLVPTLEAAFADGGVHVIACPVDYSENMKLTDRLGELTIAL